MRFLSCYIAGFGKFVDRSFDLSQDIVVIKEDNGWGKTTLAAFLKCMLYGLDGGRSKSLKENERAKYAPWKSVAFGGHLTFSYNGKIYRIERAFGKTASGDETRVYDQNNMPCYAFGEKPTRIGELLFGMDAESYARSVYIPQGEVETGVLPDTMKNRLLALLGNSSTGEGAGKALEILDNAERALRAKRRPAKGKLDEIDERLAEIAREKTESRNFEAMARQIQSEMAAVDEKIARLQSKANELTEVLEKAAQEKQSQARAAYIEKIQAQKTALQAQKEGLQAFFKGVDGRQINVTGAQTATTQFYQEKAELDRLTQELRKAESALQEKTLLETKLDSCVKMMQSYRLVLEQSGKRAGAGTRLKEKWWQIAGATLGVALLILGIVLLGVDGLLGGVILFGGGALAAISFALTDRKGTKKDDVQNREEVLQAYANAEREHARLQTSLQAFPAQLKAQTEELRQQFEQRNAFLSQKEESLKAFFSHFAFSETYDYRMALSILSERIEEYQRTIAELAKLDESLQNIDKLHFAQPKTAMDAEMDNLQAQRNALEREKQELMVYRARLSATAESYEKRNAFSLLDGEESRLTEEKARLEKRLYAVKAAKDFLIRAQENLATRYLDPVTKNCHLYLQTMGAGASSLRFSADGAPLFEEDGVLRETAYYSEGMQDLVGFCTRIALAEAVFQKEKPCLILDDPFTDLDDKKTEQAKQFVRALSSRYQILYFTCKKERKL